MSISMVTRYLVSQGKDPALLLKCNPRAPVWAGPWCLRGVGDSSLTLGGSALVWPLLFCY